MRIGKRVYTDACFMHACVCACISHPFPFPHLFVARSFEPLPLCGGSHLALFKEILMALDGILRPNFAVGNFAESGNSSSRIAHFLSSQSSVLQSINKWSGVRSKSSLPLR